MLGEEASLHQADSACGRTPGVVVGRSGEWMRSRSSRPAPPAQEQRIVRLRSKENRVPLLIGEKRRRPTRTIETQRLSGGDIAP
jgi:hypothetical protein